MTAHCGPVPLILQVLRDAGVPSSHRVYQHSFLGNWQEANDWMRAFPNIMFGVCPLSLVVKYFLVKFEWGRLQVETDGPCQWKAVNDLITFSLHIMFPFHIVLVYHWLARGKQVMAIVKVAWRNVANFLSLFDLVFSHDQN